MLAQPVDDARWEEIGEVRGQEVLRTRPWQALRADCMTGAVGELADKPGVAVPRLRIIDAAVRAAVLVARGATG